MKHNDVMTTLQNMNQNKSNTKEVIEKRATDDQMKKMELERQRKAGL